MLNEQILQLGLADLNHVDLNQRFKSWFKSNDFFNFFDDLNQIFFHWLLYHDTWIDWLAVYKEHNYTNREQA